MLYFLSRIKKEKKCSFYTQKKKKMEYNIHILNIYLCTYMLSGDAVQARGTCTIDYIIRIEIKKCNNM